MTQHSLTATRRSSWLPSVPLIGAKLLDLQLGGGTAKGVSTDSEMGWLRVGGMSGRVQDQGGETGRSDNCQADQEHGIADKLDQLGEDDGQPKSQVREGIKNSGQAREIVRSREAL